MDGFVHLHVHSHYSLLDGAIRIRDLVRTVPELGMDAVALTDHGNLFGAVEFYTAAKSAGIKPILGMEGYISPTDRHDRSMPNQSSSAYHILLLAMNETGWGNLMKLSSRGYLEGFYYRPRIDLELLGELNEGLICTTACMSGQVPRALLSGQMDLAAETARKYLDIFGKDRFFIEVQDHGLGDQRKVNPLLVDLAGRLGVGVVGTNDAHFLTRGDKPAHEVLTCISTGQTLNDPQKLTYSPEMYVKDPTSMREALSSWEGAGNNTVRIAEMCNVELDFSTKHLPVFETPDGCSPQEYLRKLAAEGLERKFADRATEQHRRRLEHELETIEAKEYSSYVLIVHDFVRFAKANGIPAAARGSACATLLGYCLGIGDVDPMRYGLLFERWTDVQRQEDPDFDIDICQEGRNEVIQYVREKYGHVAQIITYGTLKARAAIRDVGRVMDIPLREVDAIAKKIPEALGVTISSALETEPDLKNLYDSDERIRQLFDYSRSLEGLARHAGVHAAGVIIATGPLEDIVPLCKQSDSDVAITQWAGPTCDKIGLMKVDFLGLRTLSIIQRARELAKERTGQDIDPETIPLDDPKVFELFCAGHTDGVFQFESDGMRGVLTQMRPQRIEDLIAANAMYRPGPMELIPTYCNRKNGGEEVPSIHPLVDDLLSETYGIMVYQEQIMQVLNRLGKLSLGRALTLIKAISKKKAKTIASEKSNFITGAAENGIEQGDAERLFELILKFAGYGFNKAHSTRYAIVAYQTAYFKVHFPREFLAATLTFECGDTDKVAQYLAEAERMGVKIGAPDINTCGSDFAVDGEAVRFGLAAVKGVGSKAVDAIVEARGKIERFADLYHFCENVDLQAVNRTTIEALIKCGAFDALGAHRAAMLAAMDKAISLGQGAAADRKTGQMNFFSPGYLGEAHSEGPEFPDVEPLSETQLLAAEKEALGFYVTSHPLVRYGRELDGLSRPRGICLARLDTCREGTPVTIGCMIASVRYTFTRKDNRKMAMLTLEDLTGKSDAVVFPRTFDQVSELLRSEAMVFVTGTVDWRRERANIIVSDVIPIDKAIPRLTGRMVLRLTAQRAGREFLTQLRGLLEKHHGDIPLLIELTPSERIDVRATIRTDERWGVAPSRELLDELGEHLEQQDIVLVPKGEGNPSSSARGAYRRSGTYPRTRRRSNTSVSVTGYD